MSSATKKTVVPDKWDATQIQSLKGQVAIITGANSGIGYEAALELARKGADVVLACRSEERGKDAEHRIQQELATTPGAGKVQFAKLDVSSLKSVQDFSVQFMKTHDRLNILINNAGIMAVPHALTVDGYESHFATNHLGHFALTAQLFPLIKESAPSRIVNVSSGGYKKAKLNEDEIVTPEDKYSAWIVYANTKLANVLFTKELDRRIKAAGIKSVTAVACHPGLAATNLATAPATDNHFFAGLSYRFVAFIAPYIFSSAAKSALPTLYAAAGSNVQGGDFIGRDGFLTMWGYPVLEETSKESASKSAATKLWTLSERLAKLSFDIKKDES